MKPQTVIGALLAVCGFLISFLVYEGTADLHELSKGVSSLNEKIAVVVQQVNSHETRITHLEVTPQKRGR